MKNIHFSHTYTPGCGAHKMNRGKRRQRLFTSRKKRKYMKSQSRKFMANKMHIFYAFNFIGSPVFFFFRDVSKTKVETKTKEKNFRNGNGSRVLEWLDGSAIGYHRIFLFNSFSFPFFQKFLLSMEKRTNRAQHTIQPG